MNSPAFGDIEFSVGWQKKATVVLWKKEYEITIKAKAYLEKDGISKEQEEAYSDFKNNMNEKLALVEKLLASFSEDNCSERFVPQMLIFERTGEYAMLFDDKNDEDDGIAVCIAPEQKVMYQDEYL